MSAEILNVDAITKVFESVRAVDGLSFTVRKGEIFGLLGPNGAGKTTAARMLLGIVRPDSGFIRYFIDGQRGEMPLSYELGYLPEDRGLYKDIAVQKTLVYMGILRGMHREDAAQAAASWLEKVGLTDRAKDKLDTLSKGNQQKVQFISAVLHKPAFAILDEPFSGLDPINQEVFVDIIRSLRDGGTTVLLSAHQMNLVERLADRVLLMNQGREVLQGTIPHLKEQAGSGQKVILSVEGGAEASLFGDLPAVVEAEQMGQGRIAFHLRRGESINEFLVAVSSRVKITAVHSEEVSLHEAFVQFVRLGATQHGAEERP